jgi:hypothetical protein
VLHVGRRGVDLELEHLVPARVPPLVCITAHGLYLEKKRYDCELVDFQSQRWLLNYQVVALLRPNMVIVGSKMKLLRNQEESFCRDEEQRELLGATDLGRCCSCAPGSGTARPHTGLASLQVQIRTDESISIHRRTHERRKSKKLKQEHAWW